MKKSNKYLLFLLGHQPQYIPSSWVNDGVCDCCDASDEYLSDVQCVDNCRELGREAWLEAQRVADLAKEGNKIRQEYITRGKQLKTENQARLTKLRTDYEEAQMSKKEKEVIKNKAEERENIALEKYKPAPPQQAADTEGKEKGMSGYEAEEYFKILDSDGSGTVTITELQTRVTFDKDRNGEVSRDEALFFLINREEITMQEFIDSSWSVIKPFLMLEKGKCWSPSIYIVLLKLFQFPAIKIKSYMNKLVLSRTSRNSIKKIGNEILALKIFHIIFQWI